MKNIKFSSLRIKIAIIYSLLTLINIVFFSVMIFENQTDLLITNIQIKSNNLVKTIATDLQERVVSKKKNLNYKNIKNYMLTNGVDQFTIFDKEGNIWHQEPISEVAQKRLKIDANLQKKLKEITPDEKNI
ncbi:MAG: regulator, partial [Spirochaetota bacterium]